MMKFVSTASSNVDDIEIHEIAAESTNNLKLETIELHKKSHENKMIQDSSLNDSISTEYIKNTAQSISIVYRIVSGNPGLWPENIDSDTACTLVKHEKSVVHNENIKSWITLSNSLKNNKTVDHLQLKLLDSKKKHWINVLEIVISVIKFLARQCLAFRGTSKTLYEHDNGNFLKAIEMIASFDSVMEENLHKIVVSETKNDSSCKVYYLEDSIQNEIIKILGRTIKTHM